GVDKGGVGGLGGGDGDVRFAHRKIEFSVIEYQLEVDAGMKVQELVDAVGQPGRAQPHRGGDAERAGRLLAHLGQARADRLELDEDLVGGTKEMLALLR